MVQWVEKYLRLDGQKFWYLNFGKLRKILLLIKICSKIIFFSPQYFSKSFSIQNISWKLLWKSSSRCHLRKQRKIKNLNYFLKIRNLKIKSQNVRPFELCCSQCLVLNFDKKVGKVQLKQMLQKYNKLNRDYSTKFFFKICSKFVKKSQLFETTLSIPNPGRGFRLC